MVCDFPLRSGSLSNIAPEKFPKHNRKESSWKPPFFRGSRLKDFITSASRMLSLLAMGMYIGGVGRCLRKGIFEGVYIQVGEWFMGQIYDVMSGINLLMKQIRWRPTCSEQSRLVNYQAVMVQLDALLATEKNYPRIFLRIVSRF